MHKSFICSSIINLLNNSKISKIRRWRIELYNNKNFECDEDEEL